MLLLPLVRLTGLALWQSNRHTIAFSACSSGFALDRAGIRAGTLSIGGGLPGSLPQASNGPRTQKTTRRIPARGFFCDGV
jgi:hypothetical protein